MTSRIIAVGNLKGGTGKSTVAVNLACHLAEHQPSVLLIDADPQGTASAWLQGGRAEGTPPSLALAAQPLERVAGIDVWRDEIGMQRRHYERIVVDLPPQMGQAFEAALQIADLLVVPVTPSAVDLYATAQALAVLHRVRRTRAGRPACLLVPSKVDRRTSLGRDAGGALGRLGCEVGPALSQRAAHPQAFGTARWIGAHAPGSDAHAEVCALVAHIEDQLCRCKAPEDDRPISVPALVAAAVAASVPASAAAAVQADARSTPATEAEESPGAPARIGGAVLHLVAALFAKLRRAEQASF